MITRMTSLAALVAAGMTLAACQEEEAEVTTEEQVTTEEAGNEVDMEPADSEVVETEAEPEAVEAEDEVVEAESEPVEEENELVEAETDTVIVEEGETATEGTTGDPAAEVEENATAPTETDMPEQPEAETAAEVDAQAAEVDAQATASSDASAAEVEATAAEVESTAGATGGSDQNIEELLTTENFQPDEVVTYLETADIDDNTREALTQAVEQVDTSDEAAVNALISRLEIALGIQAGAAGQPAATTE